MADTATLGAMTFINFEDDWIITSRCSHHLNDNAFQFSSLQLLWQHVIITADNAIHPVKKESGVTVRLDRLAHGAKPKPGTSPIYDWTRVVPNVDR